MKRFAYLLFAVILPIAAAIGSAAPARADSGLPESTATTEPCPQSSQCTATQFTNDTTTTEPRCSDPNRPAGQPCEMVDHVDVYDQNGSHAVPLSTTTTTQAPKPMAKTAPAKPAVVTDGRAGISTTNSSTPAPPELVRALKTVSSDQPARQHSDSSHSLGLAMLFGFGALALAFAAREQYARSRRHRRRI